MRTRNFQALLPRLREVWRLSLPAILTQITTIAMQYIDSVMVGRLGANASAAIGLVASSTWLFNGVCYALSAPEMRAAREASKKTDCLRGCWCRGFCACSAA